MGDRSWNHYQSKEHQKLGWKPPRAISPKYASSQSYDRFKIGKWPFLKKIRKNCQFFHFERLITLARGVFEPKTSRTFLTYFLMLFRLVMVSEPISQYLPLPWKFNFQKNRKLVTSEDTPTIPWKSRLGKKISIIIPKQTQYDPKI